MQALKLPCLKQGHSGDQLVLRAGGKHLMKCRISVAAEKTLCIMDGSHPGKGRKNVQRLRNDLWQREKKTINSNKIQNYQLPSWLLITGVPFEFSRIFNQRVHIYILHITVYNNSKDTFSKRFIHFWGHTWAFSAMFDLQKRELHQLSQYSGTYRGL